MGVLELSTLARVSSHPDLNVDLQSLFEFGLARMLDGLDVLVKTVRR